VANDPIKRLRYYTGQFLEAADFKAEQDYHVGLRRFGNRAFYIGAGILDDGFQVALKTDDSSRIVISPGIGVDGQGRELVLVSALEVPLPQRDTNFFITLHYAEMETDQQVPDADVSDTTRLEEKPVVGFFATSPEFDPQVDIVIARLKVSAQGIAEGAPDLLFRQPASARIAGSLKIGPGDRTIPAVDIDRGSTNNLALRLSSSGPGWGSGLELRNSSGPGKRFGIYSGFDGKLHVADVDAGADRLTVTGAGDIGVGTATPRARLELASGALMPSAGGSDTSGILFPPDPGGGAGDKAWIRYYARTGERTALELGVANDAPGAAEDDLLLMPSGAVGIGTTSPTNRLHVDGGLGIRQNSLYLSGGPGGSSVSYNAHRDPAAASGWRFPDVNRTAATLEIDDGAGNGRARVDVFTTTLQSRGSWVHRLRIDGETGHVGIGTISPANRLHLHGDSRDFALTFTNAANTAGKRGYRIAFDNDRLTFQRAVDTGGFLSSHVTILQETGFVGIGTDTPSQRLHVNGGAVINGVTVGGDAPGVDYPYEYESIGVANAGMNLRLQSPNAVVVHAGGEERLLIDGAGNTAISGTLSVGGALMVTGPVVTRPINNADAKNFLIGRDNGTAIIGAANGVNEPRLDFYFKYGGNVWVVSLVSNRTV